MTKTWWRHPESRSHELREEPFIFKSTLSTGIAFSHKWVFRRVSEFGLLTNFGNKNTQVDYKPLVKELTSRETLDTCGSHPILVLKSCQSSLWMPMTHSILVSKVIWLLSINFYHNTMINLVDRTTLYWFIVTLNYFLYLCSEIPFKEFL